MGRTLAHPPIKEAILEVLFNFPDNINQQFIKKFGNEISDIATNVENIVVLSGQVDQGGASTTMSRNVIGYQYRSNDKNIAIQTKTNGFAFSFLNETYKSWDQFSPIALETLRKFILFTNPSSISRFSLRFVNKIEIPSDANITDYLNLTPNVGAFDMPIAQSLMRTELVEEKINAIAIITQLLEPAVGPTFNAYLDIDVIINNQDHDSYDVSMKSLSHGFDQLRELKNRLFFGSLTDFAIKKFE